MSHQTELRQVQAKLFGIAFAVSMASFVVSSCGDDESVTQKLDCVSFEGAPGTAAEILIDVGCENDDCLAPSYAADGPYSGARGFGWTGEAAVIYRPDWVLGTSTNENPFSSADEYNERVAPYLTWIEGLSGYRIDVPDGVYQVTLLLLEPIFPEPGLRVFDVASNGTVVIPDIDLAGTIGQDEIAAIAIQVASVDGRIEIELIPKALAPPLLAGLVVKPAEPTAPSAPSFLEARAGAGEILLRWELPSTAVRGWLVERSMNGGPFLPISALLSAPSFVDRHLVPGESATYRVSAMDASCEIGDYATSSSFVIQSPASFGLPVMDIVVDSTEFAKIHVAPEAQDEIPASVSLGEETATGTIRLRGRSTLWMAKRSFKIELDNGSIDGRDRLNLLAEQPDPTRLWQLLGYDLFGRMDALASRARSVLLRINGKVYGVYDDIEHVGDDFLTTRNYGVDDRFRMEDVAFALKLTESGEVDLSGYEKKENEGEPSPELESLIVWLNTAAEHEVEAELGDYVDIPVFVDYLVGQIFMANNDIIDGGHYLVLDPGSNRFMLVPWDLNNLTWSWWDPSLSHFTLFDIGPEADWTEVNWLWTRAIANHSFRDDMVWRIEELMESVYADEMADSIDSIYATIAPALAVEPFVWRRRYDNQITDGPGQIHEFVANRRHYIEDALARFEHLDRDGVVLSKLTPGSIGLSSYVELWNRGATAIDLQYCWLSDDPMNPLKQPLAEQEVIESGERRSLDLNPSTMAIGTEGGFVGLWCGGEHEGDDGYIENGCEESCYGFRSAVFYPALTTDQSYQRDDLSWQVQ